MLVAERHEAAPLLRRPSKQRRWGFGMYRRVPTMRYEGEAELIAGLRAGEEDAFAQMVDLYGASLMRVAALYVRDRAVVQEVVQETWLGVLRGIDRFEGRSAFSTWLFRILTNIAKTRAVRESRSVPFAVLSDDSGGEPSVSADNFLGPESTWPGHWAVGPVPWKTPLDELVTAETRQMLSRAIDQLPPMQRQVVSLRDVEGWSSQEVCGALEISEANQRVLLHRARSRLRVVITNQAAEDDE